MHTVALKLHFQQHIQKDMNQWNACYKHIQNEKPVWISTMLQVAQKTEALYKAITKKHFDLVVVWNFFSKCQSFSQWGSLVLMMKVKMPPQWMMSHLTMTLMLILTWF
jgi:hypothetical protein